MNATIMSIVQGNSNSVIYSAPSPCLHLRAPGSQKGNSRKTNTRPCSPFLAASRPFHNRTACCDIPKALHEDRPSRTDRHLKADRHPRTDRHQSYHASGNAHHRPFYCSSGTGRHPRCPILFSRPRPLWRLVCLDPSSAAGAGPSFALFEEPCRSALSFRPRSPIAQGTLGRKQEPAADRAPERTSP